MKHLVKKAYLPKRHLIHQILLTRQVKQHDEKMIPRIIRKVLQGENIPIYGDSKNIRDWLYVRDHCTGIDLVYYKGKVGEVYNISGCNEPNNNYIAKMICEIFDKLNPKDSGDSYGKQITFVEDRAGHHRRYAKNRR